MNRLAASIDWRRAGRGLAVLVAAGVLAGCAVRTPRARKAGDTAWALNGIPVQEFGPESCGAGSLSSILAYHGDPISLEELDAQLPKPPGGGVLSVDLLIAARDRGYEAHWVRGDEAQIEEALLSSLPVILMFRVLNAPGKGADYYHYVVVDGIDAERGLYRFHFGDGMTRWIPFGRGLERAWRGAGYALLLIRPDSEARLRHALVLESEGRLREAEESLRAILWDDPDSVQAWVNLGNVLSRAKRPREAEWAYGRAVEIDSIHPAALNNLAWLLYERGALSEAETFARRAALGDGNDHDLILDTLGRILLAGGRCAVAASTFRRGLDWTPSDRPPARASLLQGLALAHIECGDPAGARAMLEEALAADPEPETARLIRTNLAELPLDEVPERVSITGSRP